MSRSSGSTHHSYTLEQYEQLVEPDEYRSELSRGQLVREPRAGGLHSDIVMELAVLLRDFVKKHDLGKIVVEGGFRLSVEPPTVRGPDIAFIAKERIPEMVPESWWPFAPDLAVEIVSPAGRVSALHEKIFEYFETGTRGVWVVDARTRSVTVYNSLSDITIIRAPALLPGGAIMPGLELSLDAFLPPPA
jgi:Uma2 family endonuclease